MNKESKDTINLSLPINATFVSVARLTSSNIAYRMGFAIDDIEDIKAAVSEGCTYIIKNISGTVTEEDFFTIEFDLRDEVLNINLKLSENSKVNFIQDDLGIKMMRALADTTDFELDGNRVLSIALTKSKRKNIFCGMED